MNDLLASAFHFLNRFRVHFLFLAAAVLLLSGLGASPVYILDEAKNAQAAREMMEQGEWIVPTFNGTLRAHKPPLHYYFMRLSYSLFGVNPFGARFFSAVMGWLTIWITWYFVKRFIGKAVAFLSAAILLLSTHFLFEFRLAVPDPYLIFFTAAGIFCFYAYVVENRVKWLALSAIAIAFAVLAKGPVALILPGLSCFCWVLIMKRSSALFSYRIVLYFLLILAIALPWYIAVHYATDGDFTREFFFTHNLERFEEPMEGHGGSFLLIPLYVVAGLLPASVFLGGIFRYRNICRAEPLCLLCVCVTAVTLMFFSISGTKLPNYPMPCYPFVAVMIGLCLAHMLKAGEAGGKASLWILLVLTLGLLAGAFFGLSLEKTLTNAQKWPLVFLVPVLAVALALFRLYKKGLGQALGVVAAGYFLFNLIALSFLYPSIYRQNPVSKTLHLFHPGEQVYAYGIYNAAYNFYLDKPIIVLPDESSVRELLAKAPDAKIVARESTLETLAGFPVKVLAREKDLFETPVTVVFSGR